MNAQPNKGSIPPEQFRALDPDLPLIAAQAAVELDNLILATQGKLEHKASANAVSQLAERLDAFHVAATPGGQLSLVDPVSADVIASAYRESKHESIKSLGDLNEAAKQLALALGKAKEGEKQPESLDLLRSLRDFCVALSNYSAFKRQSAFGMRPVPFFRKLRLA